MIDSISRCWEEGLVGVDGNRRMRVSSQGKNLLIRWRWQHVKTKVWCLKSIGRM